MLHNYLEFQVQISYPFIAWSFAEECWLPQDIYMGILGHPSQMHPSFLTFPYMNCMRYLKCTLQVPSGTYKLHPHPCHFSSSPCLPIVGRLRALDTRSWCVGEGVWVGGERQDTASSGWEPLLGLLTLHTLRRGIAKKGRNGPLS